MGAFIAGLGKAQLQQNIRDQADAALLEGKAFDYTAKLAGQMIDSGIPEHMEVGKGLMEALLTGHKGKAGDTGKVMKDFFANNPRLGEILGGKQPGSTEQEPWSVKEPAAGSTAAKEQPPQSWAGGMTNAETGQAQTVTPEGMVMPNPIFSSPAAQEAHEKRRTHESNISQFQAQKDQIQRQIDSLSPANPRRADLVKQRDSLDLSMRQEMATAAQNEDVYQIKERQEADDTKYFNEEILPQLKRQGLPDDVIFRDRLAWVKGKSLPYPGRGSTQAIWMPDQGEDQNNPAILRLHLLNKETGEIMPLEATKPNSGMFQMATWTNSNTGITYKYWAMNPAASAYMGATPQMSAMPGASAPPPAARAPQKGGATPQGFVPLPQAPGAPAPAAAPAAKPQTPRAAAAAQAKTQAQISPGVPATAQQGAALTGTPAPAKTVLGLVDKPKVHPISAVTPIIRTDTPGGTAISQAKKIVGQNADGSYMYSGGYDPAAIFAQIPVPPEGSDEEVFYRHARSIAMGGDGVGTFGNLNTSQKIGVLRFAQTHGLLLLSDKEFKEFTDLGKSEAIIDQLINLTKEQANNRGADLSVMWQDASVLGGEISSTSSLFSKELFREAGMLTNQDIARAMAMFPKQFFGLSVSPLIQPETDMIKLLQLRNFIKERKQMVFQNKMGEFVNPEKAVEGGWMPGTKTGRYNKVTEAPKTKIGDNDDALFGMYRGNTVAMLRQEAQAILNYKPQSIPHPGVERMRQRYFPKQKGSV